MLGALHLNVGDAHVVSIEILEISVGFCIPQKIKDDLTGLDWPTTLGHLEGLCLWCAANASSVLPEGNALLLLENGMKILLSILEVHALDRQGDVPRVLVVNAQIHTHGLASLAWVGCLGGELHGLEV